MTLWLCNYIASGIRKLGVITMYLDRYSTYEMLILCRVNSYQAVLRNLIYRLTVRIQSSEDKLLSTVVNNIMAYYTSLSYENTEDHSYTLKPSTETCD